MNDELAFLNPMQAELAAAVPKTASSNPSMISSAWKENRFLDRLRWQESGGYVSDEERALSVGDTGRAIGPYQIWPIYVEQANKLRKEKGDNREFSLNDRTNRAKSEEIIDTVMPWMVNNFKKAKGRNPTETEMARLHHSGGMNKIFGSPSDIEYGKSFDSQKAKIDNWENSKLGYRPDGTRKGFGFFGPLSMRDKNGKVFKDKVATEISVGVNIGGKEYEIPSIVPTLTSAERVWITTEGNDPRKNGVIMKKAIDNAKARIAKGLSPFKDSPPGTVPEASPQRAEMLKAKKK